MDEDTLSRFRVATQRLIGKTESTATIGLAVSGGPDSLALLLLAYAAYPGRIAAATVDHQLRAEAAVEARFVEQLCAERSIPHEILTPESPISGNIQSKARQARYALLNDWARRTSCDWIATAHHADDQLETLMMRLARGSGVDGLSGIRSRNGRIIRPLLNFTKAQLVAICETESLTPVHDPSNEDIDYDRVRIRQYLQSGKHPFDPVVATRSASALAQASLALKWMAERLAKERLATDGDDITLNPDGLPAELQRRLLKIALQRIVPDIAPRGNTVDHALEMLSIGKTITIGNILCEGGAIWHFRAAPPRKNG